MITCQQGLQFFPDPVASLDEMRRALRDGGVAGVSIWTSVSEQIFHVLHDAAETVLGPELAARYRGPFLMAGDQAAEAARAAGFADVTIVTHTMPAVIDEGFDAMFDTLVASGIATDVAALDQDAFGSFRDEAARIAQRYADGSTLRGSMTASIMLAS